MTVKKLRGCEIKGEKVREGKRQIDREEDTTERVYKETENQRQRTRERERDRK